MDINDITDINYTISKNYIEKYNNSWEIIPNIYNIIIELIKNIDKELFNNMGNNIWVYKDVVIDDNVKILGPCIIDEGTVIKHSAYIRENVIIGKNCIIGNASEIKNSIIFDKCEIPHFNYVGDSIMGYKSHLGAGTIIANLRLDKANIFIKNNNKTIDTGLNKMGAIIGSNVEIGANSVINPGTVIYSNTIIYPLTRVKGIIKSDRIIVN